MAKTRKIVYRKVGEDSEPRCAPIYVVKVTHDAKYEPEVTQGSLLEGVSEVILCDFVREASWSLGGREDKFPEKIEIIVNAE